MIVMERLRLDLQKGRDDSKDKDALAAALVPRPALENDTLASSSVPSAKKGADFSRFFSKVLRKFDKFHQLSEN